MGTSDEEIFNPANLELFEERSAKEENDRVSRLRERLVEAFVEILFVNPSKEEGIPLEFRSHERYQRIRERLHTAFTDLPAVEGRHGTVVGFSRMGGRSNNYDFELWLSDDASKKDGVRLELKFGESIFNQPQILSLYVNNGDIQGSKGVTYAHFFHSRILPTICERLKLQYPDQDAYLAGVFDTTGSGSPFAELRRAREQLAARDWIDSEVHDSIDAYLTELGGDISGYLDLGGVSKRLLEQCHKLFLSIAPNGGPYVIQRISREDLTATGEITFKTRPNSTQKSSINIHMTSGAIASMLLRWKNHNGVQGPAWQISLDPPPPPS